jgi:lon-related putative ATP-dependent protease
VSPVEPLSPDQLLRRTDAAALAFGTTDELEELLDFLGQERASHAVDLGVRMRRQGYNIFAFGAPGTGKLSLVQRHVREQAATQPAPPDWCYVNNFDTPSKPRALALEAGLGKQLRNDMQRFADDLRRGLSAAFESEEVQVRRGRLTDEFQERQQASLNELQEKAQARGLTLLRTPSGLAFAPLRDGAVVPPEEYEKLPEEERKKITEEVDALQEELQKVLYKVPSWERELRGRMRDLHREITSFVLSSILDDLTERYTGNVAVLEWLKSVEADVVEHVLELLSRERDSDDDESPMQSFFDGKASPRRYQVNVLVDSSDQVGAPVVYESNPTFLNLIGRVEHLAQMGALTTDFMLIKAGCLHRANGGTLILDAQRVLTVPYAWEGLKRALQQRQVRIESPLEMMSLTSTVSLEPEPIPLDVKVVLIGEPSIYYLLSTLDPDFAELFKVSADFDDELERTPESELLYARLIATIARREGLLAFEADAVARLIEQAARMADDSLRLTARISELKGLMEESSHWAERAGAATVARTHVAQAVASRTFRLDRVEHRLREQVLRGSVLIDTTGERIGQINALSVVMMGKRIFGHPSRISATVRVGSGDVVDIEREVDLGGPIHSKGVLILTSYLRSRYAPEEPLSLSATLAFEQNYGGVEGDSASSTELYVLLSALAQRPIRQGLGVTGSVNQMGQVQAVGGVNEKIEGFYDLCVAAGLTGDQGCLIPASNVQHLMLREDVVEAVAAGRFHIYPIATVDEGIELLTGLPAGERQADGNFPEGSLNRLVMERLASLSEARRKADDAGESEESPPSPPKRGGKKKKDGRPSPTPDSDPTRGPSPTPTSGPDPVPETPDPDEPDPSDGDPADDPAEDGGEGDEDPTTMRGKRARRAGKKKGGAKKSGRKK